MWHVQAQYKWSLGMSNMKNWQLVTRMASSLFGCSTKVRYRHEMTNASVIAFGFYTYFCFSYPKVPGTKRWWTTATSQLWPVWDGTPTVKRSALFTKMEWLFWDLWMVNRIDYNRKIKGGKTIRLGISLFPHCGNEYKHVQWDKCLLFIFVGNRLWVKELKGYQLAHVAWSPDSKILLFGMANGEVQIFDNQGNFVVSILVHFAHFLINSSWSVDFCLIHVRLVWDYFQLFFLILLQMKMTISCLTSTAGAVSIAGIHWYAGTGGYIEPCCPCLAICFDNGRCQIMRCESDESEEKVNKKKYRSLVLTSIFMMTVFLICQARCVLTHRWMWCVSSGIIAVVFLLWQDHSKPPTWRRKSTSSTSTHRLERFAQEFLVFLNSRFQKALSKYALCTIWVSTFTLVRVVFKSDGWCEQHLRTLKVPGKQMTGIAWEGAGLRIALAVDSYLYFANIRPDYKVE